MMRVRVFLAWLFLVSAAFAQVEVKTAAYYELTGLGALTTIGDRTLSTNIPNPTAKAVGIIRVDTKAANVEVSVSDQSRIPFAAEQLTDKIWIIDKPGRWWIDVTAIDFDKNIYGRKQAVLDVGGDTPGPGPDPGPGPTPPGPVANEYGVGIPAYKNAPKHASTASDYSRIYQQAADFLFGVPSLKFIVSSNEAHSTDPNRSVLAWIAQQQSMVQCPDPTTCEQWKRWQKAVSDALVASQKSRQYTRQDWYNALNEISRGVGAVR